jgi:hypothetical protein
MSVKGDSGCSIEPARPSKNEDGSTQLARLPEQANERCSRQALFGCGFAAMVVTCLQLN